MDRVLIDFPAGAHGNFLEFVLNKNYHSLDISDPFTSLGTSHNKVYNLSEMKFVAGHYTRDFDVDFPSLFEEYFQKYNNFVVIKIETTDLLMLSENTLLRAGDMNINANQLENNTYNKLNNVFYKSMLDNIISSYSLNCTPNQPNVPRYILREFFKFGFKNPHIHGFMQDQSNAVKKLQGRNVLEIPFSAFYDYDQLLIQLNAISAYFNLGLKINVDDLRILHNKFISKIPNLHIKTDCDAIINAVQIKQSKTIPALSLLQESYINARLENIFGKEMPLGTEKYFTSTEEILEWIDEI